MDDDPVPKALIDAMNDPDDFKPLLEALHTIAKCWKSCRWQLTLDVASTGHEHGGFYLSALTIHPCLKAPELRQISNSDVHLGCSAEGLICHCDNSQNIEL
jgi:hypothetical protein